MRRLAKLDACRTLRTFEIQVRWNRGLRVVIVSGPYIEVCDMSFPPYYVSRLLCWYCARHGLQQLISRQKSPMSCCSGGNSVSIHFSIDMQIWNVRRTGTGESLIFCPNGRRFVTGTNTEWAQQLGHVHVLVHSVYCRSGRFGERSWRGEYECPNE